MSVWAVIVAAGSSTRLGGSVPKQFRDIAGRPLLSWTIQRFEDAERIDNIVVVVAEEHLLYTNEHVINPYGFNKVTKIVPGGAERDESVLNGLNALPISCRFVAIHDGARPLVRPEDVDTVVDVAMKERAAILACPITDTVKRVHERFIFATLDRRVLYAAQTPQVFQYDLIMEAHHKVHEQAEKIGMTDDAQLIEALGFKVKVVEPGGYNMKVTTRDDFALVSMLLQRERTDES